MSKGSGVLRCNDMCKEEQGAYIGPENFSRFFMQ